MSNENESRRTVYPSPQVFHLWANDCMRDLRGGNVSTSNGGATLWSYRAKIAHRFPAEVRAQGNARVFLIRSPFYSRTTGKHISGAHRAIPDARRMSYPSGFHWTGAELLEAPENMINGIPALPVSVYALGLDGARTGGGGAVVFSGVTCVDAENETQHRGNYAALHAAALAPLEALRKARKYGAPNQIAEKIALADLYRRTFLPEAELLPIPADAPAIVAAWRERFAKIEAREAAEAARVKYVRADWLAAHAPILARIKCHAAEARAADEADGLTLAEKIAAWETSGTWPAANSSEPEWIELLRRIVRALLRGEHSNVESGAAVPADIKAALPPRFRFSDPGLNALPGGEGDAWEAAGIAPFTWQGHADVHTRATYAAHRNLLRLSADGGEVITSGGARVPASIARILWKRHGGLMAEAVEAASVPAFPNADGAAIPFGPFTWTGWEEADANAREAGAGNWLLRVGCHRISPADLCRMAKRHAWEGGCA
jgi:hypothetical protein